MTGAERLEELAAGKNIAIIRRMPSGFAVMADWQFLPGYCLLLAYPEVNHLTDLVAERRARYLLDMSLLGEAVIAATDCARVNYGILGNLDPFLHAHVWPRYEWENDDLRVGGPWGYSLEYQQMPEHRFTLEHHGEIQSRIGFHLDRLMPGNEVLL